MFHLEKGVHVGAPRPSKRTKLTSYLNRCFPLRARARFRSWRRRAGGRRAPPSGRGRFDRNPSFEVTQSRPGRVIERSRAAVDTQQLFSSRIELAHLRKPRVRIRPRPLDLRPPVSRLVQPPRLSLRVPSCVVCRGQMIKRLAWGCLSTPQTGNLLARPGPPLGRIGTYEQHQARS